MCLPALAFVGVALGASAASAAAVGTTATLAVAGTAAAGGMAAYGAHQQAQAQKNMMNYQKQAAETQAQQEGKIAQANITGVQDQASLESNILSKNQSQLRGQQAAAEGAQGLGGSVTAADIAKSTYSKQQMDQMTLQYNANVKAWDITNRTNQKIWALGVQSGQFGMGAKTAEEAGDISTASTLLSTASQIGTESTMFRTQGVPTTTG